MLPQSAPEAAAMSAIGSAERSPIYGRAAGALPGLQHESVTPCARPSARTARHGVRVGCLKLAVRTRAGPRAIRVRSDLGDTLTMAALVRVVRCQARRHVRCGVLRRELVRDEEIR
jgi:hypothetical protein